MQLCPPLLTANPISRFKVGASVGSQAQGKTMSRVVLKRRMLLAAAGCAASLPPAAHAAAPADWDTQPETRPTDSVVAADRMHGPHYTLGETVTTLAYLNRYTISTDYGPFIAPSDTRLRRLLREIAAIAQLQAMQQTDAFKQAAIEAGKSPFRSAKNLLDDPIGTLSAIPEGIGSIFNRAQEQVHRQGRSRYEDGPAKQLLAVSSYKRDYAAKLGVDVYSSNEALQKELDRLAWASAVGNLTLGALSLVTGALALQVASNVRMLEQAQNIVASTPPSELSKRNREQLKRLAVPDTVADRFLRNAALSPRHETIIVASMVALGHIPGQASLIGYASSADTEDAALLFQQMAELITNYHTLVAPVRQIDIVLNLPLITTTKGTVLLLLPIDRLLWTERSAGLAKALAGTGVRVPEIWISGDASPRAEAGLAQSGLLLTQHIGKQLPLLD
jgi:hypothetical protein